MFGWLGERSESELGVIKISCFAIEKNDSDNHYHNFCGYSYALRLCLNELSKIDYNLYQELLKEVNKGIIKDYVEINNFWKKYDGKIEEVSKKSYDLYLKQNNIQTGIKNYNESISLILNFKNQINE